jgi:hypothetical protein
MRRDKNSDHWLITGVHQQLIEKSQQRETHLIVQRIVFTRYHSGELP